MEWSLRHIGLFLSLQDAVSPILLKDLLALAPEAGQRAIESQGSQAKCSILVG